MKLILRYLKHYKGLLVLNIIAIFGFALVELGIPTIVSEMIDNGVMNQDKTYLIRMGLLIAVIAVIGVTGTILLGFCCAKISTSVTRDIRDDVFVKVSSFSPHEMNQFGVSSLITRTNNDAFQIMMFLNVILRTALLTPVMVIISFTLTIRASLSLSLIIASTVPVIVIGVIIVAKISGPISDRQQKSLDAINRIFRENLTGIRVIRAFNNDAYESQRFDRENSHFMKQSKNLFKLMSATEPVFFLLMNIAALIIYYTASVMIDHQTLLVGQLVAFMEYLFHAMFSVMLFCMVFMMYPRANISAKRILAVLETNPVIHNPAASDAPEAPVQASQNLTDVSGNKQRLQKKLCGASSGMTTIQQQNCHRLVFDHVDFVYPDGDEAVLKDISFEARSGQTTAFIGSTGSGKSSLIRLIPRFYDIASGKITIDGQDIAAMDLHELRDKIGFVPQRANLFSGTIADNIRFGKPDATMEEIKRAARIAQAYDFIMEKPHQLNERIVEGATNVSGGQKQRLSIARALVRRPEIYIYDDSFSALDFKTDAALRQALKTEVSDAIVLIVAQRVSTIMDADQIIVLNEGRIAGIGTHRQLLQSCPIYHEIAASQLSEEELQYA